MRPEPTPSVGLPATAHRPVPRADRRAAITAAQTAARSTSAAEAAKLDREILTRIASGGLLICETELRYQLGRRGHDRPDLLELLAGLEQRGLIESETHYRLTAQGVARVPLADRPAPRAISSIPWTSRSVGAARQASGVPSALRPARQARRSRQGTNSPKPEAELSKSLRR